jgi:hypothetical protein
MCWSNGESLKFFSTGFSRPFFFFNFPPYLQANAAMLPQSRPQPIPVTHSSNYHFHIILPIHTCHHILEDLHNMWCTGRHVTEGLYNMWWCTGRHVTLGLYNMWCTGRNVTEDLHNMWCRGRHVTEGSPQTPGTATHHFQTLPVTSVSSVSWFNITILVGLFLRSLKYTDCMYKQSGGIQCVILHRTDRMWSSYCRICLQYNLLTLTAYWHSQPTDIHNLLTFTTYWHSQPTDIHLNPGQ